MSGRIFQNVVLQFKETTDRVIGVMDAEGSVIACSELTGIGKKWTKYVEAIELADGNCVAIEGKTFKALPGWGSHFDYAVFASGDDSVGRTVCAMACVALNSAKAYYEEKHDKGSFIKNIISDNILPSDIYMRAKELHVPVEANRGVFVIRPVDERMEAVPMDAVQSLFPDRQNDFVLSVGEADVALIHQLPEGADPFVWLFSESAGRVLVAVPRTEELRFTEMCTARGLPWYRIGVADAENPAVDIQDVGTLPLAELREAWQGTLPELFG